MGREGGTGWGERDFGKKQTNKKNKEREREEESKARSNLVEPEAEEQPRQWQQLTG